MVLPLPASWWEARRDGTWLWLGRQEEALIAADSAADSVCLSAGLD